MDNYNVITPKRITSKNVNERMSTNTWKTHSSDLEMKIKGSSSVSKQSSTKVLPERGPDGRFIKRLNTLSNTSSTATSTDSSPLDTPELIARRLDQSTSEPEHEGAEQELERDNDDSESLPGAPNPQTIIWPVEDIPSPPLDPNQRPVTIAKSPRKPPVLPSPPVFTQLPPPITLQPSVTHTARKMTSTTTPGWFHGKSDENGQNFLKEVERYIVLSDLKTEAAKVLVFSTLLSSGSVADTWWTKLDSVHKTNWVDVKAAFTTRWPAIVVAEKTGLDYQREILALRLAEDELGTQITIAGVPTWAHLQFSNKLQELVNEAGANATAGLVYQVCKNLPLVVKELTTPGLAEWKKFLEEIRDIDTNKLREKAEAAKRKKETEKAQNARLARLENMQSEAVEIMRLQLQRSNLGPTQTGTAPTTAPNNPSCIRYVPRGAPVSGRQRQPLTQEEKDLLRSRVNDIPHHPDTAAGRTAYDEQLKQWFATYGQEGRVTKNTQFPL